MIAYVDVHYEDPQATAACAICADWSDDVAAATYIAHVNDVQPYEPGHFYKRELPCLRKVLDQVREPIAVIVVDGYVWLSRPDDPGLGAHLFQALDQSIPIIGVAKSRFAQCEQAVEVVRGESDRPLYITSAGIDLDEAARRVQSMHGKFRLPTMLRYVDHLCRGISS